MAVLSAGPPDRFKDSPSVSHLPRFRGSRASRRLLGVWITQDARRRLRLLAAARNCTTADLFRESIRDILTKAGAGILEGHSGPPPDRDVCFHQRSIVEGDIAERLRELTFKCNSSRGDLMREAIDDLLRKYDDLVVIGD